MKISILASILALAAISQFAVAHDKNLRAQQGHRELGPCDSDCKCDCSSSDSDSDRDCYKVQYVAGRRPKRCLPERLAKLALKTERYECDC